MKENLSMDKEMVKEENILMNIYNLKEYIKMEKNGKEKDMMIKAALYIC